MARKLAVAIWHLLKGHYSPLEECSQHLDKKLRTIAAVLGRGVDLKADLGGILDALLAKSPQ